jgi:hypothetical protein
MVPLFARDGSFLQFLCGALAGVTEVSITYPLECVKTLMQVQVGRYKGMVHCMRSIYAERGLRGFYYGLSSHLLFAFPRVGVRFQVYDLCKSALQGDGRELSREQAFVSGLAAGFTEASLCTVPLTTLSVRLCADAAQPSPRFTSLATTIPTIVREEGFGGLYRGAAPTLLKVTLQIAARFSLFNELRAWLVQRGGHDAHSACLIAGGAAGGITVCLNHPLDVVKSRIQAAPRGTYEGMLHCFRATLKEAGYRGLFLGFSSRLLRVIAETSLTFYFHERYMSLMHDLFRREPGL